MGVRQRRHAKCAVLGRLQELVCDPWGELIDFAGFSLSNYRYDINRCLAEKAVARSLTAFCQHNILMISVHVGVRYLLLCSNFFVSHAMTKVKLKIIQKHVAWPLHSLPFLQLYLNARMCSVWTGIEAWLNATQNEREFSVCYTAWNCAMIICLWQSYDLM